MRDIEKRWRHGQTRRRAIASLAAAMTGAPLAARVLGRQRDPRPLADHVRHRGLDEMVTAFDFEPLMFANVPLSVYDYTAHGDGSEFTLRRNREAFEWVDLIPAKSPIAPAAVDLSTTLLGAPLRFPLLVAPTAAQGPLHPDAEPGMRRGAEAAARTPMVLSHNSSTAIDRVAAAASAPLWAQFYPQEDMSAGRRILEQSVASGCTAIVVTVDQVSSFYERSQQNANLGGTARGGRGRGRGGGPSALSGAARYRIATGRLWYSWQAFDEIRSQVNVPVVIKGILSAEDARLAVAHGASAIVVSNHGGRSMDYGPSTLEVLPGIVDAVDRRIPVIIDSGFRHGRDVLKALALGASAVLLGRTTRWALAAFGPAGVQRVLEIVQRELTDAAAACGCRSLRDVTPAIVRTRFP